MREKESDADGRPVDGLVGESKTADVFEFKTFTLRESSTRRLRLQAKVVEVDGKSVPRGRLVYERKKKAHGWDTVDRLGLNTVKAGEGIAVDLPHEDLAVLCDALNSLNTIAADFDHRGFDVKFIRVEGAGLAALFGSTPKLTLPPGLDGEQVARLVAAAAGHDDLSAVATALAKADQAQMDRLLSGIAASAIDALLEEWASLGDSPEESKWQALFENHAIALQHLFYSPAVLVQGNAYVGGTRVDRKGGKHPDFLFKTSFGRLAIVEIKTPGTSLLQGTQYRRDVWPPSNDLSGSVCQALAQRDQLMETSRQVMEDADDGAGVRSLHGVTPLTVVVAGSSSQLDTPAKRRSFERFRSRPDVVVLTFDELRNRLAAARDVHTAEPPPEET